MERGIVAKYVALKYFVRRQVKVLRYVATRRWKYKNLNLYLHRIDPTYLLNLSRSCSEPGISKDANVGFIKGIIPSALVIQRLAKGYQEVIRVCP